MAEISLLENLPEISILKDEEISLEGMQSELINDYEVMHEELTGETLTLYPADERRILLNVAAGKLFQLAEIMNDRFRQNFLQYMYGDFTKNWAANFGFIDDGIEYAKTTLRFHLSKVQDTDVTIPKGTRATAGDNIFFATDHEVVVPAGDEYADSVATCTEAGAIGNNYSIGQINIIADPVNLVQSVENVKNSTGGHDEYTNDELKEKVLNFTATYSTAGPEGSYEELVKQYSSDLVDAKIITNSEAVVMIYLMLSGGVIPSEEYCEKVFVYLKNLKATPDTDKIVILAPETVPYSIDITYYIQDSKKDIADAIKDAIKETVDTFVDYTASKVGRAINPNLLISFATAAGASRLEIRSPFYESVKENQVAICSGINIEYGGLEKE